MFLKKKGDVASGQRLYLAHAYWNKVCSFASAILSVCCVFSENTSYITLESDLIHFDTQLTMIPSIKKLLNGAVVQWGALLYQREGSKYTNQRGRICVEISYPIKCEDEYPMENQYLM